jgi:predicted membrane protein
MKPQDVVFFIIIALLAWYKRPQLFLSTAMISMVLSALLFHQWVFFTAQRLLWYAAACIAIVTVYELATRKEHHV